MGPRTILLLILIIVLAALYTPLGNFLKQYIKDMNVVIAVTIVIFLLILGTANYIFEKVLHLPG
jgi:hypothetical protein